jgi:hypothetical protein
MTRDQFISNMMGKSWSPNDPADILELQQFVLRAEWWPKFVDCVVRRWWGETDHGIRAASPQFIKWLFSDASRFADLVAEFDKMRKGKPEGKEGEHEGL